MEMVKQLDEVAEDLKGPVDIREKLIEECLQELKIQKLCDVVNNDKDLLNTLRKKLEDMIRTIDTKVCDHFTIK